MRKVKFIKDNYSIHKWWVHSIDLSAGGFDDDYHWNFREKYANLAIKQLKQQYNLVTKKSRGGDYSKERNWYNISINFKDAADEAEFILKASSGQIILDDSESPGCFD